MARTGAARNWLLWVCLLLAAAAEASPGHALAQASQSALPLHVRTTLALATMFSDDQTGRMGFNSFGFVGDVQLGYSLSPWLDVRVGTAAGSFQGKQGTGNLLQPQLGAAVGWPSEMLRPWLQLDAGAGFTGTILRPVFRASIGLDLRVSNEFTAAPVLGYWQLFQKDGPLYSTDARFVWFGVAIGWEPGRSQRVVQRQHITTHRYIDHHRAPGGDEPLPEIEHEPQAPSPELIELIEGSLPSQKNELLAPVLFDYDSDVLKPQGIAMLHEVARELARKPKLKRVEISGYADARGGQAYNVALSERRARAVLEWLVAHGVERERLSVAGQGASELVERGADEPAHEQNRRVVFRVLEEEKP